MLKSLLALVTLSTPVLGETLVSGAIYFDSENTLLEVQDLIKEGNQDGLARLFKGNHISDKLPANMDIVVLFSDSNPEGKAEFHFINNPTTYWTFSKYIKTDASKTTPTPFLPPVPNSTLPANLPSSLIAPSTPIPIPTPTSTPTPTPKSLVAMQERKETSERKTPSPLHKHRRTKEQKEHPRPKIISFISRIFGQRKAWHKVNGHWKWYYVTSSN
jgi:hypothetical protein